MSLLRGYVTGYHGAGAYQVAALPAGIVAGDLLVAVISDRYLPSVPVGWTTELYGSGTNQSGRLAWKIADGSDIGTGTMTYVLAGAGTGSYVVLAFEISTFNVASPIASAVQSTNADINDSLPYVVINAGQSAYHFAAGKTVASGAVLASGKTLLERRNADPDAESALYTEIASSDTTTNVTWAATQPTTGAYKVTFVLADPPGTTTLPGISGEANIIVAIYDVAPIAPEPTDILYTTSPELVVLADGSPSPFQVQFQTSSTSSFGVVLWSQTLTGQVPGTVTAIVGTALTVNVTSYWRARAGDGTSWGPWCGAQTLNPLLERTNAAEYMHLNAGAGYDLVDDALSYMPENVGLEYFPDPSAREYMHENVGFEKALDRRGGEYLHENAFVGTPVPHLWFAWLAYGFPNDHIYLYGQGLGTLQGEYNASIRILDVNTGIDQGVSIFDWSVNPAGVDAYTELRKIYRGSSDIDPPLVTQEADIIEVIVPVGVASPSAVIDFFFATTDGGTSNKIEFLLYPQIPWAMASATSVARGASAVRLGADRAAEFNRTVLYTIFEPQQVVVTGGMMEAVPEHLLVSRSTFSFDSGASTADLEDPVSTPVPLGARWRPLSASVVAHPELGTGVSLWEPLSGSENAWRIENGTDPYVNETNVVTSRAGDVVRPSMIFPGNAWMAMIEPLASAGTSPSFSLYMVAVISSAQTDSGDTNGVILASFVPGGQPASTFPFNVTLIDDTLYLRVGVVTNRNLKVRIPSPYLGQRPVILHVSIKPDPNDVSATPVLIASMTLLADSLQRVSTSIQRVAVTSQLWLGRDDTIGEEARMVVLDAGTGSALSLAAETKLIGDLDGAYGVSGA